MARARLCVLAVISVLLAAACATQFQGAAKFPGGPRGCYDRCQAAGLRMSSFVYVGEYSTGCVCSPKPTGANVASDGHSAAAPDEDVGVAAATGAAAVGVIAQMREAERQQAAQRSLLVTPGFGH
jgi:hypothetical protein